MTAESAAAPPATVPPATRLTRRQDFLLVLQDGQRVRHPLLGFGFRPNGLEQSRVGFAVGKRVGNAVTRNLVRRRLRAITRATALVPGYDIVVTARQNAAMARYGELEQAFRQCARRGTLLAAEAAR
ncbi:MAG TPA: ribonuclease P protein component [Dehalococcoidia bacterium]|nr:ribonuclease P protein component [Dehalococcoidia bacterium]